MRASPGWDVTADSCGSHQGELLYGTLLAVRHSGVALDVRVAPVVLDGFSDSTLPEDQVVKRRGEFFRLFEVAMQSPSGQWTNPSVLTS